MGAGDVEGTHTLPLGAESKHDWFTWGTARKPLCLEQSVRSGEEVTPEVRETVGDKIMKGQVGHWEGWPCPLRSMGSH